jgi:hypothetical protein
MNPSLFIVIGGVAGYFIACYLFGEQLPLLSIQAFLGTALGVVASIGIMYASSTSKKQPTTESQKQQSTKELDRQNKDVIIDNQARVAQAQLHRQLLQKIAGGDNNAASEIYQAIQNYNQGVALYGRFQLLLDDDRKKVLSMFTDAPDEFRRIILAIAKKSSNNSIRAIIIEIILLPFFVLFGINAITSLSIGSGLIAIFGLIICGFGLVTLFRNLRIANETIVQLKKD